MAKLPRRARGPRAESRSRQAAVDLLHDYGGADRNTVVEILYVFVRHPETARRHSFANRLRLVGTMKAIERAAEIHGAGAKRVVFTADHVSGKSPHAGSHLWRRSPARPLLFVRDLMC